MENEIKELLFWTGLTIIGVFISYYTSPLIAKELNNVSTNVLNVPLNESVIESTVFLTMSTACIGIAGYKAAYLFLEVLTQIAVSGIFMMEPNINPVINPIVVDPIINNIIPHIDAKFSTSQSVIAEDLVFLNELKVVTKSLRLQVLFHIEELLNRKTFHNCMLIPMDYLEASIPIYHNSRDFLETIDRDFLFTHASTFREIFLLEQINKSSLLHDRFGGVPGYNWCYTRLVEEIGFANKNQLRACFIEAIQQFGSSGGGVTKRELFLRYLWALEILEHSIHIGKFMDGAGVLGYSDLGGVRVNDVIWLMKTLHKHRLTCDFDVCDY